MTDSSAAAAELGNQSKNGTDNVLDVEGGKIYYEECGTGDQAVLLVHDGVVHSAVWDDVWPVFCKNFHTIRYDRRGYGRSPVATGWYNETDDMFALLRRLKIRNTMLVGSSHGGELSIEFTLEHPNLVKQLVLVGAVVHGYPYSYHFLNRGQATWGPAQKGNLVAGIKSIADDKYLTAADHPAARQRIRDLLTAAPQDFAHSDMARSVPSSLPRLNEIRVPTLILVGDADIPDVHAHAGAIETGIPNSRRIVIPDTGHLMYLEKPEEFTRIVIDFLRAHWD
jgi:3-oxoadipate enol-lactonase